MRSSPSGPMTMELWPGPRRFVEEIFGEEEIPAAVLGILKGMGVDGEWLCGNEQLVLAFEGPCRPVRNRDPNLMVLALVSPGGVIHVIAPVLFRDLWGPE